MCCDFENSLLYFKGFTLLMIMSLKHKSISTELIGGCDVSPDLNGRIKGNCQSKAISRIPPDLGEKIEILDISNNTISTLDKDDLKNYPKLRGLIMRNLPVRNFPEKFFKHTPSIEVLDVSSTQISNLKEIPSSIKVLNLTMSKSESVDLSQLVKLEKLVMRNCDNLKQFPTLAPVAPLKTLDVKYCPLAEAHYSQIAPFCLIGYFGLNSTKLKEDQHVERCCALRKWGIAWRMKGYKGQNCSRARYKRCLDLNLTLEAASVKQYKDCFYRIGFKKFMVLLVTVFIAIIVILILTTTSMLYYYYKFQVPNHAHGDGSPGSSIVIEAETEAESDRNSIISEPE